MFSIHNIHPSLLFFASRPTASRQIHALRRMAQGFVKRGFVLRIIEVDWPRFTPPTKTEDKVSRLTVTTVWPGRRRWQKLLPSTKSKSELTRKATGENSHSLNESRSRLSYSKGSDSGPLIGPLLCTWHINTWLDQQSRPLLSCFREVLRRIAEL